VTWKFRRFADQIEFFADEFKEWYEA
jgi:hypothetical protein